MLVLEVSRHGARESGSIYNFTVDPNQNFNGTGNILPLGRYQHFDLGQRLREKYILGSQKLLSENYTAEEIEV